MDPIMGMASIGNHFTLINVFADDAIPSVAKGALATPERAIREAGAPWAREAWVGQTTICGEKPVRLLKGLVRNDKFH